MAVEGFAALGTILAVALAVFAMRAGGYVTAAAFGIGPLTERVLRLAPGHLFIALTAAAMAGGGLSVAMGAAATIVVMVALDREWAGLLAGAAGAALGAWIGG
jgi:uncharacterized membrane protein